MSELGGTNVTRMSSVLLRLLRQSFLNLKHIISEQKYNFQFVPNSTRKNNPCGKIIIQKLIKGGDVNPDSSGLSKREWNELMVSFNLKDKLI